MKFEELKIGHRCIEVKSKVELGTIINYCRIIGLPCDFTINKLDVKKGHNLFVIWKNDKARLFWNHISGDRKKFDISDIDEFGSKELPQIDLSNKYILIDENRDLLFDMLEEQEFVWCCGGEKPREWDRWKTITRIHTIGKEIYNGAWEKKCINISNILKKNEKVNPSNFGKIVKKAIQPKQFTKSDLEDGMVVERLGGKYLVLDDKFIGKTGYDRITDYDENLLHKFGLKDYSVMKVFKSRGLYNLDEIFLDSNLQLIWQREENTPPKWTDWKDIENNEMFEFRQKGLKIEVRRSAVNGITVSATCLPTDTFDLRYGQQLCIKKWNVEFAKKSLDDYLKGVN